MPQGSIEDIFRQVARGQADFGVVPVENSTEGAVGATLDELADSQVKTCGETFVHVSQALVSQHPEAADIKTVFSHPQALAQCRTWLAGNLPHCNLIPMQSTAAAAARACQEPGSAAVGNPMLAELFGLQVVARDIQDHALNQTRFLVIGHQHSAPTGRDKTSIVFSTRHLPGALLNALMPLADFEINLTRIESRPAKDIPWNYIFFVDFEGHLEDTKVRKALDAIKPNVHGLKVLGSYPVGRVPEEKVVAGRERLPIETATDEWPNARRAARRS
jgi:chorismate mutase/prephenate dehydratase